MFRHPALGRAYHTTTSLQRQLTDTRRGFFNHPANIPSGRRATKVNDSDKNLAKSERETANIHETKAHKWDFAEQKVMYTTWGVSRISQRSGFQALTRSDEKSLNYPYYFSNDSLGFIIQCQNLYSRHRSKDYPSCQELFQGRVIRGPTFGPYGDEDGHGHGTSVAATAAGHWLGVAQRASVTAIKVLGDNGNGRLEDIRDGLEWVEKEVTKTGGPSVLNLSIGGLFSRALDDVILRLTSMGVHVVVTAGNSNQSASKHFFIHSRDACNVGASNLDDMRAPFSNYGKNVSIFAPGVSVISAGIGSDTDLKSCTGTSMAAPLVAGAIACVISAEGNMTPRKMIKKIKSYAIKGVLRGLSPGTDNLLAQTRKN